MYVTSVYTVSLMDKGGWLEQVVQHILVITFFFRTYVILFFRGNALLIDEILCFSKELLAIFHFN